MQDNEAKKMIRNEKVHPEPNKKKIVTMMKTTVILGVCSAVKQVHSYFPSIYDIKIQPLHTKIRNSHVHTVAASL